MAFKSMVGASLLLAALLALSGCQNTPQRQPANPGFAQKQGSTNPPLVPGNPSATQPNGSVTPAFNAVPGGGIPTTAPTGTGSQYRSTAPAPFINPSGPGPGPVGFGNPTPPALGPNAGLPGSYDPPIAPPQNPGVPGTFPRN